MDFLEKERRKNLARRAQAHTTIYSSSFLPGDGSVLLSSTSDGRITAHSLEPMFSEEWWATHASSPKSPSVAPGPDVEIRPPGVSGALSCHAVCVSRGLVAAGADDGVAVIPLAAIDPRGREDGDGDGAGVQEGAGDSSAVGGGGLLRIPRGVSRTGFAAPPPETNGVAFAGAGLFSGGGDGAVHLWDPSRASLTCESDGAPVASFPGHSGPILSLCTAEGPGGSGFVVTGSEDGTVRVWDPRYAKCARVIETSATDGASAGARGKGGSSGAGGSGSARSAAAPSSWVGAVSADAAGNWIASGTGSGGVAVTHIASGAHLCRADAGFSVQSISFLAADAGGGAGRLAGSASGVVAGGTGGGLASVVPDGARGARVSTVKGSNLSSIWGIAVDPNAGVYALAGEGAVVDIMIRLGSRSFGVSV